MLYYVGMCEANYNKLASLDQLRRVVWEDTYFGGGICSIAQDIGQ